MNLVIVEIGMYIVVLKNSGLFNCVLSLTLRGVLLGTINSINISVEKKTI